MIKLNNKNITYVALADSSNSLKAPKEIWYADSSNSVKLVYRRKDALIEGVDYEKYHWAKTDGSAYINTLVSDLTNVKNIYCKIKRPSDVSGISNQRIFGRENESGYSGTRLVVRPYDNHLDLYTSTTSCTLFTNNDDYININAETNTASTSRSSSVNIENINKNGTSLALFADHGTNSNFGAFYKGSIGEFTINELMQLVPCKLLKPVPKWLDANGIRRQVGECGMIDLVSGKFYGNVNSVGTFTVENYYERKEHLVSTNAYIDTKLKNITDKNITISFSYALNTSQGVLFGSEVYSPTNRISMGHHLINDNFGIWFWDSNTGRKISDDYKNLTVILDATQSKTFVNGINITDYNPPQSELYNNILLFAYYRKQTIDSDAALITSPVGTMIDNFIVQNTMNLIPCTLTMDLPASMDANNIARTKGTSGMWDLVSDKFYGNVANSGTFKAVNLAEGVDYEVHQWLVGDNTAYIQGISYDLWDNHLEVEIGKLSNSLPSMYISYPYFFIVFNVTGQAFQVIFRQNDSGYPHIADIYPYSSMPDVVTMDFYIENSLFYCNQNGVVKTNDPSQTAVESTWKSVTPQIYSAKMSYIREVLSDSSYRSNLIPVKLLKPIPSKYDANGIARQAGECGMYDTVNDVFYGNVASSGNFTVSDDN